MPRSASPRFVLGTADLGDDALTARLLDRFVAGDGRGLDVANSYGDGASARAVGRWIGRAGAREEVVLYA